MNTQDAEALLKQPPAFEELTPKRYESVLNIFKEKLFKLEQEAELLRMKLFKQSSERLANLLEKDPTPLLPGMEDLLSPAGTASQAHTTTQTADAPQSKKPKKPKKRRNCGFPAHLPREEVHLWPEGYTAEEVAEDPDLVELAPEISEELAVIPQAVYVRRIIRHKVAKRSRPDDGVASAPPLPKVFEKGRFNASFIATVIVSKYVYHLPLHRQEVWFQRHGIPLARSTLCRQVMNAAKLLQPLYDLMNARVLKGRNPQKW